MSKVLKGAVIAAGIIFTGGAAASILGLTGGVLSSTLTVVNALAASAFLSGITAQLTGRPKSAASGMTLEYSGTVEPRRIIYGEVVVSGLQVIPPLTSGANNRMLHQVLALAGHEVAAIPSVYFDTEAVGTITAITGSANDGKVTTGTWANKAWVRRYLGTATQGADYILDQALSVWTSDHVGRGVAYLALQYEYDEAVWKTGRPQVTARVQGKKVYDPRLDSTNGGEGSHRLNDASTWEYSNNPALICADYLLDPNLGVGEPPEAIDWEMVAAAADICDEEVETPGGTQKRYTCNVALYATPDFDDNLKVLAGSMLGYCVLSGEKWRIRAGAWSTPEFEISDDDVVGEGIEITTAHPIRDRWNGVRGTFINPAIHYQLDEFPAIQSADYVSEDGEEAWKDVRLEACTDVYEAMRAAILLTRQSRSRQVAKVTCNLSLWKVRPGMRGIVTLSALGWSARTVVCEGWKFHQNGAVDITVREQLASDWDDPAEEDYLEPLDIATPTPVYFTPDAPSLLTARSLPNAVHLSWAAPALMPTGAEFVVYEHSSSTPFASATPIWRGRATSVTLDRADTRTSYFWVRVEMPNGTAGAEYPTSAAGVAGAAIALLPFTFVARGDAKVIDRTIYRDAGASAWDSDVYSSIGYVGGAYAAARPAQTDAQFIFGLNSDPASATDYNSIDYGLHGDSEGGLWIVESGDDVEVGTYAAGDDLQVVYDGARIRYIQNGTVLAEKVVEGGKVLYFDSSLYKSGARLDDIRFGPVGVGSLAPFNARGACVAALDSAAKVGGSDAWDSDVYSTRGYGTCHLQFKANDDTSALVVGLATDPLADTGYENIEFGFDLNASGEVHIYEADAGALGQFGEYDESTVLAITYDGEDVRYFINSELVKTTNAPGLTLYMGSSFYTAGSGIHSLIFGPTTKIGVVDTVQLAEGSATDLASATEAGPVDVYATSVAWTQILTVSTPAYPFDVEIVVSVIGAVNHTAGTGTQSSTFARIQDFAATNMTADTETTIARNPNTSILNDRRSFMLEKVFQVTAGTAKTFRLYGLGMAINAPGSSCEISGVLMKAEVIKR